MTDLQVKMLEACAKAPEPSWRWGAGTVSSLRKLGFIEVTYEIDPRCVYNAITDEGRKALALLDVRTAIAAAAPRG